MRYSVVLALSLLFFAGCVRNEKHPVNFYYWKTDVSPGNTETDYFNKLGCRKLYLRFFDVDIENGRVIPKAGIIPFDAGTFQAEFIPVVFITNRTFERMTPDDLKRLAENFNQFIKEIKDKNNIPDTNEIQLDCDWTESTRSNYFFFISELKKITGKEISCTVRLHQIKYKEKTGIPPVSKAYLMCYATSNPAEFTGKNSILDISLLKDYTRNIETYPLTFDIALPLYSWAVVMNHLGKIKLINGITREDLPASCFKQINETDYEVENDFFFRGIYLNKGFIVRIEQITPDLLQKAKKYLNDKIRKPYGIVYYHLDKSFLERFTISDLE
ncbi:MAG: hypothetical protein FWF54_00595 [Candidatus Azobacteroides sp.]|nr:hypothetical protein [Candidatus Azobacteroides sp.]